MKPYLIFFILLISFSVSAADGESFLGTWINEDSTYVITIYEENNLYHATITEVLSSDLPSTDASNDNQELRNRPLVGVEILSNFELNEDGKLKNGKIYNYKNGNTYNGKLQIKNGELELTGYYGLLFFLGKTQKWRKYAL